MDRAWGRPSQAVELGGEVAVQGELEGARERLAARLAVLGGGAALLA